MFIRKLSCFSATLLPQHIIACRLSSKRKSSISSALSHSWITPTPWFQGSHFLPPCLSTDPRHVISTRPTSWFSTCVGLLMDRGGHEPPYKRRRSAEEKTVKAGDVNREGAQPPGMGKSNNGGSRREHHNHCHKDAQPQSNSRIGDAIEGGQGSKSKYIAKAKSESTVKDGGGLAKAQSAWSKADNKRSNSGYRTAAKEVLRDKRSDETRPQLGTSSKLHKAAWNPPPPRTESAVRQAQMEGLYRRWEASPACLTKLMPPRNSRVLDFSVMSYNILSQDLLQENAYLYRHCPSHILDWTYRLQNLLAEIQTYDADVLCLQEVQEDHFENHIRPALKARGYQCEYKKRTGQKPDGCAIVFKTSRLSLLSSHPIEFFRPGDALLNRDNVGLVVLLQPSHATGASDSSNFLCVANTHLLYNPRRGDVKLAQLAILLAEISRLSRLPDGSSNPVVLCGDFNSTPWSPLFNFLIHGFLEYRELPINLVSGQEYSSGQWHLKAPIWSASLGINQQCQYESTCPAAESSSPCATVVKQISKMTVEDLAKKAAADALKRWRIEHGLKLCSSYEPFLMPDWRPAITTCHSHTAMMVDYVLYTPVSLPGGRGLQLLGKLSLVGQPELWKVSRLPNRQHSSDHLPLLVRFRWVVTATGGSQS
ncbi:protein angel homolog 2 [Nerophis ophidion]|uniref:protein angel homolog 2 n=1 Tax=Nerophis ophidion TaxID=159077 RepID=UPI002ADFFCC3|nr:protein angel homolog 2 [Nerophis ophidion]XP_061757137.1 protein angel homolog 2 [Nerophis ophidion]XP_061757138.1 protein angel homolog 2 [Nerophis ophidion]